MPETRGSSQRFIPSFAQLQEAAASLPDPMSWEADSYVVRIAGRRRGYRLEFRRIRYRNRDGRKIYRWIYEGKVQAPLNKEDEDTPEMDE